MPVKPLSSPKKSKSVVILGAGVAGLAAAWKLSEAGFAVTIVEKMDHIGGLAATFKWKNYELDLGPHKFYTILPGVLDVFKKLIGRDVLFQPKTSKIRLFNQYLDYPVKIVDLLKKIGPWRAFRFGMDYGLAQLKNSQPANSEDYLRSKYGNYAFKNIFLPLSEKIWGHPSQLDVSLAETRVPAPTIFQLITGMIFGTKGQKHVSADVFYYPRHGIGQMSRAMWDQAKKHGAKLLTKTEPVSISANRVTLSNKSVLRPDYIISTIHLKHLVSLLPSPPKVRRAATGLKHRSLILVFLAFKKDRMFPQSWIFFPESKYIFSRLSEQKTFSPYMIPKNQTVLIAEIPCEFNGDVWNQKNIVPKVVADLVAAEIISPDEKPIDSKIIKIGNCYPLYDLNYKQNLQTILDYLSTMKNFYTIGRPGLFFYDNTDHSLDMGLRLANHIISRHSPKSWQSLISQFFTYRIVD